MIDYNPLLCLDFYKTCHAEQYPKSLRKMVSYYTPRKSRIKTDKLCLFGLQAFIKEYLIDAFNNYFFNANLSDILAGYKRILNSTMSTNGLGENRISNLHELGYLPLEIRALPEGIRSNMGVPQIEISNTHPDFVWLVNSIETMLSCSLWHTQISAEVGYMYRQIVNEFADMTCNDSVDRARLIGDFSMRGQESVESATKSSSGFCLSFLNTATVPAAIWLERNYNCDSTKEPVIFGSLSTEHSVMCSNFAVDGDEITHLRRLLTEIYPDNSFSVVSDSYDYWNIIDNVLPALKNEIMAHNGVLAVRGDSGDPVEIVTKTVFKLLETFGYTINSKGYKVLPPKLKVIYGDSITPNRCKEIYELLSHYKVSISNVALGVGSFSMQCLEEFEYVYDISDYTYKGAINYSPYTRDTFGIAVKATYAEDKDGSAIMIYKNPKTDVDSFKRSQRGCCRVIRTEDEYSYVDGLTFDESRDNNELITIFKDGSFIKQYSLTEVRENLHSGNF